MPYKEEPEAQANLAMARKRAKLRRQQRADPDFVTKLLIRAQSGDITAQHKLSVLITTPAWP